MKWMIPFSKCLFIINSFKSRTIHQEYEKKMINELYIMKHNYNMREESQPDGAILCILCCRVKIGGANLEAFGLMSILKIFFLICQPKHNVVGTQKNP